jgi:hypothetical protein
MLQEENEEFEAFENLKETSANLNRKEKDNFIGLPGGMIILDD